MRGREKVQGEGHGGRGGVGEGGRGCESRVVVLDGSVGRDLGSTEVVGPERGPGQVGKLALDKRRGAVEQIAYGVAGRDAARGDLGQRLSGWLSNRRS